MSEEFDFISRPESKNDEHVWCKIDQDGKLEVFDWEFVEKTAVEYDAQQCSDHLQVGDVDSSAGT